MIRCLGKSCSFGLPRMPFVNCCQFMYLVISLLLLRAGYGIWLYQFLNIAYLFTFDEIDFSLVIRATNSRLRNMDVGIFHVGSRWSTSCLNHTYQTKTQAYYKTDAKLFKAKSQLSYIRWLHPSHFFPTISLSGFFEWIKTYWHPVQLKWLFVFKE